jgi:hypothetical protein
MRKLLLLLALLFANKAKSQEVTFTVKPYNPICDSVYYLFTRVVDSDKDSVTLYTQELNRYMLPVTPARNVKVEKEMGAFYFLPLDTSIINPVTRAKWGITITGKQ